MNKEVNEYLTEIKEAKKREEQWREKAQEVVNLYECETAHSPYNILYSNTEILAPALYSRLPKPVVKRRFNDSDPLAKTASEVARRVISFLIDDCDPKYTSVNKLLSSAVHEGLIPGRGLTRVKFDSEIARDEQGNEVVAYETVCGEEVPWDRFCHGYAKKWSKVPWIAFTHYMSKEDVIELVGEENKSIAEELPYTAAEEAVKTENKSKLTDKDKELQLAEIFEVWDKKQKKIVFICEGYDGFIKELEDEFKLSGFYPIPEPLMFFKRVSGLTPQTLYEAYKRQAEELNKVTVRINKIIDALKVRGFYDGSVSGLGSLLEKEDNSLVPVENIEKLEGKGFDNIIWLLPLGELVGVLQQLYLQRTQVKTVIFEITGMSDLIRGSTAASETLGAQELKSQWGTMRLKSLQKEVARYARDLLRMVGELALAKLSQQTIQAITNMQLPTAVEKQSAVENLNQLQMLAQSGQQQAPQEALQAETTKLQQVANLPAWEEILAVLNDDLQRNYRIDIETNSTIEAEASEEKQEVGEFLNAFAQFLNGVTPMIEAGTMSFDVAKGIMMAVIRKFRFGEEIEELLDKMQAPPPKSDADPKAEADAKKMQMELQFAEQMNAIKLQQAQAEAQQRIAEIELRKQELSISKQEAEIAAEMKMQEFNLQRAEFSHKFDLMQKKHAAALAAIDMKNELASKQHESSEED